MQDNYVEGRGETSGKYGVIATPSNYLIGKDGKVLWRAVGAGGARLEAALEAAGIK